MPYTLFIDFADNKQIGPFFIGFAIVIAVGIIIALIAFSIHDKRKEKNKQDIDLTIKREKVMDKVVRREKEPTQTKTIHQIKRETRDPAKKQEQEAAVSNTLVGGTSEAQREEKHAADYYGQLGISSRRSKQLDKAKDRAILNGYLQKSNTAPIRPVYSNTPGERQQQMDELNSDRVGDEANTPALVMDSAAPSAIRYTDNTYHRNTRQKAIQLKRPSSSRVAQPAEEDKTHEETIRPETDTDIYSAEADLTATVSEENTDIFTPGEEAENT